MIKIASSGSFASSTSSCVNAALSRSLPRGPDRPLSIRKPYRSPTTWISDKWAMRHVRPPPERASNSSRSRGWAIVASAIVQTSVAAARYAATNTTQLAKTIIANRCGEAKSEMPAVQRELGQAIISTNAARPQSTKPAATVAAARSLASWAAVARDEGARSARCRSPSRQAA